MTHSRNKVIVAGCIHGGLAVIRSLGKRGLHVIAITYNDQEFGLHSRYIAEKAICPHPEDTQAFANFLLERAEYWEGALILETSDFYATAIAQHKAELSEKYCLITPPWDQARLFIEKDKTYVLADACEVPHPTLYQPNTLEELESIVDKLVFPLIIKPVRSHEFNACFNTKLFVIDNVEQLRDKFLQTIDHRLSVLIQEIIPGTDEGTLESVEIYVNSLGYLGGEHFNIKLRQSPPMFGLMRVGKSVAPIADIQDHAYKMLQHINYRGFASFEFKRDKRDGLPKLIEVNIRQPRNGQLMIASGVDFPWLIHQDIVLNRQEKQTEYVPMYFIDLIPDIGNSFFRDFYPFLSLPKFLRPYLSRNKTFAVFALADYKPFLKLLTAKWAKAGQIILQALTSSRKPES